MTILSSAGNILWGAVTREPFPYMAVHPALPWDLYHALEREFPPWQRIVGERALKPNARYDLNAATLLPDETMPRIWREFVMRHVSQEVWETYRALFGLKRSGEAGLRRVDSVKPIRMECQLGVNTPSETPSRVIGPHIDSAAELVAGLLYMPCAGDEAGGDFLIYRQTGTPRFINKGDAVESEVEIVDTVPYRPNQAVFFVNGPTAVHGVTARQASTQPRRLVNFLAEARSFQFLVPR